MNTALAVTLATHLIAAGTHAAAPLFHGAEVVKPYQQPAHVSYQMAPAAPVPDADAGHSASYRLPVHRVAASTAPYCGTAPLPGSRGTLPPGVFAQQRAGMQSFFAQRMQDARNTNLGHAYTFRRY